MLFRQLKLSPEKQQTFVAALAAWDTFTRDLQVIRKAKGLSHNDPALEQQYANAEAALKREVESVLGPDAKRIIQDYTRLTRVRSYVASCSGMLSRIGLPLTLEQMDTLTAVIAECSTQRTPDPHRLNPPQWEQLAVRAQAILTPAQWREFQASTPAGVYISRWNSTVEGLLTKSAGPNK